MGIRDALRAVEDRSTWRSARPAPASASQAGCQKAFYFGRVPFIPVLFACGVASIAWKRLGPGSGAAVTSLLLLLPGRADAAETAGRRLFDLSWFFLRVGLFSFGGAYAVLNVVVVVLGGGALGLLRAFAPALFGGPLG